MFAEWVTKGAEIGTVAFFAIFIFALYAAVVLGMIGLGAKVRKEADNENENHNRPRPI